jgi:FKBP-type peptidyl-prolyl cis-trans isomerase FklB
MALRFVQSSSKRRRQPVLLLLALVAVGISAGVAAAAADEKGSKFLELNSKKEGVVTLATGLQYKVLRSGEGAHHPNVDTPCECHYEGTLIDGTKFDSSYDRGAPTTFAPNQVIPGWTLAMQLMVEGDKWELYIPPNLGYGANGSPPKIPPNSVLIFTMEIIRIKDGDDDGTAKKLIPAVKCDVVSKGHCSDREVAYLAKVSTWTMERMQNEMDRLMQLTSSSNNKNKMSEELAQWIRRRKILLEKLWLTAKTNMVSAAAGADGANSKNKKDEDEETEL